MRVRERQRCRLVTQVGIALLALTAMAMLYQSTLLASLVHAFPSPPGPCRSKRMLLASQLGLILTYAVTAGLIAAMYAKPISLDLKVGENAEQCRCSVWEEERLPL